MRAVLFGGPLDTRTTDVPETTESMNVAANGGKPRYARYVRVGDGIDRDGKYMRFDFVAVIDGLDQPIL